ncbi:MAG: hypothetical protein ABF274_11585 [Nonlabens sp.]|uniref:tellurite resistance TerB family protein n=1 Tax=Nonlabens sp. TaxID=1888209 RepID=UPI00321BA9B1
MVYTTEEKKHIISELILMAHADQHLKKAEIAFIKSVGKRMELDDDDIIYMIQHPEELTTLVPKDYTKRIVHFHRMMLMMHIDGHVDDQELQLLHDVALQYGFRKGTVDALLQSMTRYPHGEIPASELMEIHIRNSN